VTAPRYSYDPRIPNGRRRTKKERERNPGNFDVNPGKYQFGYQVDNIAEYGNISVIAEEASGPA
jgi:hypothetical protein